VERTRSETRPFRCTVSFDQASCSAVRFAARDKDESKKQVRELEMHAKWGARVGNMLCSSSHRSMPRATRQVSGSQSST